MCHGKNAQCTHFGFENFFISSLPITILPKTFRSAVTFREKIAKSQSKVIWHMWARTKQRTNPKVSTNKHTVAYGEELLHKGFAHVKSRIDLK